MASRTRTYNYSDKPRWRVMAEEFTGRATTHVAGKPVLRRNASRALKTIGAGVGYATLVEPRWISITHLDIPIQGLPECLEGYRIVHLTDIHHNFVSGMRFLYGVVDRANALDADIICLTGDYITHNPQRMPQTMRALGRLSAPDGVLVTRGNHDYSVPLESMRRLCQRYRFTLLENDHITITASRHRTLTPAVLQDPTRAQIVFGGVGDLWKGRADPSHAFQGAPDPPPRVLLSHNPQVGEIVTPFHNVSLQLSGHTHGGQVRPFQKPLKMLADGDLKYAGGLVQAPHTLVYVSRGVGTSAFRVRWNCRPEITLVTLHAIPRMEAGNEA